MQPHSLMNGVRALRIFDCFTFFNENDLAALRFEELAPVVNAFIIIEAGQTFRGNPKPVNFNPDAFKKEYRHKLHHFVLPRLPGNTPWEREIFQRNYIAEALKHFSPFPEETVIISDVDEIPRREVVKVVDREYRLLLDKFSYGINMLTDEGNSVVRMLPYSDIGDFTIEEVRRGWSGTPIENAGWEFSSLGTSEDILLKLKSFSHQEFDTPELDLGIIERRMADRQDIVGRDMYHRIVEVDDTWPVGIKNNREYWSKYEW